MPPAPPDDPAPPGDLSQVITLAHHAERLAQQAEAGDDPEALALAIADGRSLVDALELNGWEVAPVLARLRVAQLAVDVAINDPARSRPA